MLVQTRMLTIHSPLKIGPRLEQCHTIIPSIIIRVLDYYGPINVGMVLPVSTVIQKLDHYRSYLAS